MPDPRDIAAGDQAAARLRDRHASTESKGADCVSVSGPELGTMLDLVKRGDTDGLAAWTQARFDENDAARELLAELGE